MFDKKEACRHKWARDMKRRKSKFNKSNNQHAVICQKCGKRAFVQEFVNEAKLKLDIGLYKLGDTVRLCDLLIGNSNYEPELVREIYDLLMEQINNDENNLIRLRHPDWLKEISGPVFCDDAPIIIEPS